MIGTRVSSINQHHIKYDKKIVKGGITENIML
jgi:hypothetical protein